MTILVEWKCTMIGLVGVVAGRRVVGVDSAGGGEFFVGSVLIVVVVGAPFPDVAGHVDEAIAIGAETADGRGVVEAFRGCILIRKMPLQKLPRAGPAASDAPAEAGCSFPRDRPYRSALRGGEIPFGLGGEALVGWK